MLVKRAKDFKTKFDLTERVIGDKIEYVHAMDRFWFFIRSTLNAVGISPVHRVLHYKYNHRKFKIDGENINPRNILKEWIKDGRLQQIDKYVGLKEQVENLDDLPSKDSDEFNVFLLSPFDNSLWSREALLEQYNFEYKMEIYIPRLKRKYGYYVMPILYGTEFVGRVDVRYDRKIRTMNFINWYWEEKFHKNKYFIEKLAITINRFIRFHNADNIELGNVRFKNQLITLLECNLG